MVPNREIDFGFGCGACVCVRACEAVCGREADVSFGARASEPKFVGVRAGPGRAAGPSRAVGVRTGPVEKVKKKVSFFRILIASGNLAKALKRFSRVFVPKNLS